MPLHDADWPAKSTAVEVWIATASRQLAAAWRHVLPDATLRDLTALREVQRDRRIVQLALRRSVLAASLSCPLGGVPLVASTDGRIVSPSPALVLSASHHDDMTVFALTEGPCALGVDVEPLHELGWDDAVSEVLSPHELGALMSLPESERPTAYFTCWTLKEAVMKALGEGLSERDPKSIEVSVPPSPPRLVALDGLAASQDWSLATLTLSQHVCSLAVVGATELLVQSHRWPVDLPPVMR